MKFIKQNWIATLALLLVAFALLSGCDAGEAPDVTVGVQNTDAASNATITDATVPDGTAAESADMPEETVGQIEEPTEAPVEATDIPETTIATEPETAAPAPETTAPAPETAAPAPETAAPAPETTAPAPETTAPAPETAAPAPETTAPAPETTAKPIETTPEPEETTAPPPAVPEGHRVGDLCYDATLPLFNGGTYTVSQGRGKVTVLNFWGSWCPPCKNELPHFDTLATEYADSVVFLAVHTEYGEANGRTYVQTNYPNSKIHFAYDAGDAYYDLVARDTAWPVTVVLDQNGIIRERVVGALTYNELKAVLDELVPSQPKSEIPALTMPAFKASDVPAYGDKPYIEVNGNIPFFTDNQYTTRSYEYYSQLDQLGRCGTVVASIGRDLMPTEDRESISSVRPTGWHSASYPEVGVTSLYNRSHLIAFQLTGENANKENLITGTQYMNQTVMTRFENMVADYITETGNHVLYRVTPIFTGNNLVADGVLMEGWSVEDNGDGICFCVYLYNVQPGVEIDYATGKSQYVGIDMPEDAPNYILNTNTKKFHKPTCSNAATISDKNRKEHFGSREELIEEGYKPGGCCNP